MENPKNEIELVYPAYSRYISRDEYNKLPDAEYRVTEKTDEWLPGYKFLERGNTTIDLIAPAIPENRLYILFMVPHAQVKVKGKILKLNFFSSLNPKNPF